MSQPSPRHQLVLGLVLATLGSLFLLDNFLILDVQRILPFWPLLLVGLGVIKVAQSPRGDGLWVGGALIAVGCVLTLKHLGWLQFQFRQLPRLQGVLQRGFENRVLLVTISAALALNQLGLQRRKIKHDRSAEQRIYPFERDRVDMGGVKR